ncbi:molybdopterin-dependent oxidoreductase [Ideonella sp. 4Y16]|uniref:Molybdopterin-dependent oxidoreductase n=1 Tax=Ideonella alba TaxID=2824118 RepID=A0A940YKB8_9BURK|nr:molybdopterin-dependent oxidoreductase [Ideonella alba]MBQ0931409.1 molybdopterin-dependent oxidoreductase [Ideonella alba]MBQ0945003.1 molybdopterin-dependent oxidoreductase [Ideonella alba]
MSATVHRRICPLCEACCGLEIEVADGRVQRIRGADDDVFSRGFICPKAVALKDLHEDPDRLRTPLIRRGATLEPATWDEAFAEIERRLLPIIAEQGRDAVALAVGNPAAHKMGLLLYFARLARALGSRNVFSASTLDQMPRQLQCGWMYGHWLSVPVPDIARTRLLVILGGNPMASNGSMWTVPDFRGKARALRERGGRLVVIDPRRTETAAIADTHLAIRPGADVFLLAALLNVVFAEGLARPGRAGALSRGLDSLQAAVAPFTPETVAARCGLASEAIRTLARDIARSEAACVYGRLGVHTQRWGTTCAWLIDALNLVTGHLDEPGGAMWPRAAAFAANTEGRPGQGRGIVTGRHVSRVSGAPEVFGELPMTCLAEEIATPGPGQVRALITAGTNPVLSAPGGPRLADALDGLEFMVSLDIYLNETSRHADVILPGRSPLEDGHYDVAFPQLSDRNHARYSPAVLPADDAAHPPEWRLLLRLAALVSGQGRDADLDALDDALLAEDLRRRAPQHAEALMAALSPRRGPERLLDLALRAGPYGDAFGQRPGGLSLDRVAAAPAGIDLGELQPRLPEVLRTPDGLIDLAPAACVADLAQAAERLADPAPPLVVIGRRDLRSNNSWMHNLPVLAKGPDRSTLWVHPDDAAAHGVADGASARLAGPGGAVGVRVACSTDLPRGVVCLPHGWGHDRPGAQLRVAAERPGASLNDLLDERLRDPLSGNAVLAGVPVTLAPA